MGRPVVGVTQQATAFAFWGCQSPGFRKYKCLLLPSYRNPSFFISFKDKLEKVFFFLMQVLYSRHIHYWATFRDEQVQEYTVGHPHRVA